MSACIRQDPPGPHRTGTYTHVDAPTATLPSAHYLEYTTHDRDSQPYPDVAMAEARDGRPQ
eukprot:11387253-Prorocentrum_lima.AAC.1